MELQVDRCTGYSEVPGEKRDRLPRGKRSLEMRAKKVIWLLKVRQAVRELLPVRF